MLIHQSIFRLAGHLEKLDTQSDTQLDKLDTQSGTHVLLILTEFDTFRELIESVHHWVGLSVSEGVS